MTPIVPAYHRDAHQMAAVIATAFSTLAVTAWLVPEPADRQRILYANFRILVDYALDHGTILMTGNRRAAAVWLPRDSPLPAIPDYDHRLALACTPWTERFRALDAAFGTHHPEQPHHHLALLAVDPDHQGRGLGSALLDHYHHRLDRAGMPAYLEASSPRSRRLYLRHRYTDHGPSFDLPHGGPTLWPMWRPPHAHTT